MAERFEHHARLLTAFTFLSRITGLVREAAMSRIFGLGPVTDAFNFAFQLPNLFRRLFGEGAISAAFVPRYGELVRDDGQHARRYAGLVLVMLAALLWSIVIVAELVLWWMWSHAPEVVYTMSPPIRVGGVMTVGMSVSYVRLSYELMAIMLPYMPLVCLVAVGGSVLQVHSRFAPTAASPIILNVCFIVATLCAAPFALTSLDASTHMRIVAASVLVAGFVQLAVTLYALRVAQPLVVMRDPAAWASVRATMLAAGPMMLGLGVLQINTAVDSLIASWPTMVGPKMFGFDYPLTEGAMTALSYASRLYEFPLGVFGISIATAVFPLLSRQNNDMVAFAATVRRALRLTVFIGLPASAGLVLTARESAATLFQGVKFSAADSARVAWVLIGFAPAIWSYQMAHVLTRAFYARKEQMTPVIVSVCMVCLNLALNITLIFTPLREAGLAWSTAFCSMLQSVILLRILSRRVPGVVDREVVAGWMRALLSTGVMTLAVLALEPWLPRSTAWSDEAIGLCLKIVVAAATFGVCARLLSMPELAWTLRRKSA